ncbi:KTSC domain-containing protein [Mesorhizobium sp. M0907]|uniref:KTSC domain-containing protein n=2 Tax=Mesorhizobium TaxID=68287 RepID=UPI0033375098
MKGFSFEFQPATRRETAALSINGPARTADFPQRLSSIDRWGRLPTGIYRLGTSYNRTVHLRPQSYRPHGQGMACWTESHSRLPPADCDVATVWLSVRCSCKFAAAIFALFPDGRRRPPRLIGQFSCATNPSAARWFVALRESPLGRSMPSTSIRKFDYDRNNRVLSVWFVASGKHYEFSDVPPEIFTAFKSAFAKGRYFNEHIRNHFRHRLVGPESFKD